jgi:penicillin-insensitive murein DD-endopeptidase
MRVRRLLGKFVALSVAAFAGYAVFVAYLGRDSGRPSVCRGTVVDGRLEGGRRLPLWGDNFRAYSSIGYLIGRTFVHSAIRDTALEAYDALARQQPELRFVYAESGWPWGGRFAPHKSHSNGTAIDFMVPVRTLDGHIAELPTTFFNKLGYGVEFDKTARAGLHKIDFDAMAVHLLALDKAARGHGIAIQRVIFDPDLQPLLFAGKHGDELRRRINFSRSRSWVRHDEHYHIDFDVPCR